MHSNYLIVNNMRQLHNGFQMKNQYFVKFVIRSFHKYLEESITVEDVVYLFVTRALLIRIIFLDTKIKKLEYVNHVWHKKPKG